MYPNDTNLNISKEDDQCVDKKSVKSQPAYELKNYFILKGKWKKPGRLRIKLIEQIEKIKVLLFTSLPLWL